MVGFAVKRREYESYVALELLVVAHASKHVVYLVGSNNGGHGE